MEDEAIIKGLSIKKTAACFLHLLPVDLLREGEWKKRLRFFLRWKENVCTTAYFRKLYLISGLCMIFWGEGGHNSKKINKTPN